MYQIVIILIIVIMLNNKLKENTNNNFAYRISLPKPPNNSQIKLNSTRCLSIVKNQSKTNHVIPENVPKIQAPPKQLSYYLGKGNNEGIIRRIMNCRSTWVEAEDKTSAFLNFKWQQDQKGMKYEWLIDSGLYRGLVNQFQFHEALSNKQILFRNLQQYCGKNNIDLWKIVPPTYILNIRDDCNMMMLKQFTQTYQKHIPNKLRERLGTQIDNDIHQAKNKLKKLFCNSNKILGKVPPISEFYLDEQGEYLWIVKPTFLNRGRGIQVFSKLQSLVKFIFDNITGYVQKSLSKDVEQQQKTVIDYIKRNSQQIHQSVLMRDPANRQYRQRKQQGSSCFDGNQYIRVIPKGPSIIKTDRFLIQKYLQKPMLIRDRKFDIRIWVLVTYNLKGYVFKQGYVRLSSLQYSCKDSPANNMFMHLTNNAVQKYSQGYGSIADGNQLSFKNLKMEMEKLNLNYDECIQEIHSHIRISLKATIKNLNALNRKFCFQIYGYDFMIDRSGYPWLIQVNTNPCIQQSSKLLGMLIPRMLDDAFKLTVDPLFYGSVSNGKFKVDDYPDNQNMWLNLNIDQK